jgi:Ricin-type beta-trefoil lectin domain-like
MTYEERGRRAALFLRSFCLVFALTFPQGASILFAQGVEIEYHWEGRAKVEIAPDRILELDPSDLSGSVTAATPEEAAAMARKEAARIIDQEHPGKRVINDSLKIVIGEPRPKGGGGLARIEVALMSHTGIKGDKQPDGLFERGGHEWHQTYNVEMIVAADGDTQTYRGQLLTHGHGSDATKWFLSFPVWQGRLLANQGGKDVRIKVSREANGHKGDGGEFSLRLTNQDGRVSVKWVPVAFAHFERTEQQGPVYWARVHLGGSNAGADAIAIVNVIDESNMRLSGARVVSLLNKRSGKPLEIRPTEFDADLGGNWGPGNRAQAQQGPHRLPGFVCAEWLMLPVRHAAETVYCFLSLASMKALNVDSTELTKPGAKVSQWASPADSKMENELFRLVAAGDGWYKIICIGSGLLLDFNVFAINDDSGGCVASQFGENPRPEHQLWKSIDR